MRSDGATCGYCGCLPTRHSKKDARNSSDSVGGTSGTGTSQRVSPEKWKDEDLGWFPNPKGEYTELSNSIVVDRVVGSSPSSSSYESSPETDFIPEPRQKPYRCQNMDESGQGSRETITLAWAR